MEISDDVRIDASYVSFRMTLSILQLQLWRRRWPLLDNQL